MSAVATPAAPTAGGLRLIRVGFLAGGALVLGLVFAAGLTGSGAAMGPTERQVAILGALLLIAGAIPAPSRFLATMLSRARGLSDAPVEPLTARRCWQLVAIVVLAVTFRGLMIQKYWPENQMISGMTLWDADMARNLLSGRGWVLNWDFVQRQDRVVVQRQAMVDPEDFLPADDDRSGALAPLSLFAHTPGYSLWLAGSFALGRGLRFAYSQWTQAALDSLGCLLVFGIGRRLWSNRAGMVGALMYALSPAHVYVTIQTLAAATDSVWALLIAYGVVRLWTDRGQRPFPVVGTLCVIGGAACEAAFNSFMFWLPLIVAIWAALVGSVAVPARRLALNLVLAQLAVIVVLTPWAMRNYLVYGQFAYTRQQFWEFAWELPLGNVANPWGLAVGNNDAAYEAWIADRCPNCSPAARETYTRHFLLTEVFASRQFPALLVRAIAKRAPGLVYSSRLPIDKPFVVHDGAGAVIAWGLRILNSLAMLLFPAAAVGLLLATSRPGRGTPTWIGLGPTLFLIVFSLLFNVEHRKTTPAYGYLLALAGVAVAAAVDRERQTPSTALGTV